tara:strand:+ start:1732 stop:3048 length:1317 start_codon:yes stop_codon:yes gene_type:complete
MWAIALPAIIANISNPLLGLADTAIMGHMPDTSYLAGLALGTLIFNVLFMGMNFLRMGTTGLAAQTSGRDDQTELALLFFRAALLALTIGSLLIVLHPLIGPMAFALLDGAPDAQAKGQIYFDIRIWAAPITLTNYCIMGWLLGLQQARDVLIIQLFMNGLNIVLNVMFVFGLHMNIDGVAYGTLCAEVTALLLGMTLLLRHFRQRTGQSLFHHFHMSAIMRAEKIRQLLSLNRDIFIRTISLMAAFTLFTAFGARMDKDILATNALLMNFVMFLAFGLDGYAQAAEVLVGEYIGRGKVTAVRQSVKITTLWAFLTALLYMLVYGLFGLQFVDTLTDLDNIRHLARDYFFWIILIPGLAVWCYQLDGIFIGATLGREMRNAMLFSLAFYIGCAFILVPLWGNHGLWLSFSLFTVMRAASLLYHYPKIEKAAATATAST